MSMHEEKIPPIPQIQVAASLRGLAQVGAVNCGEQRRLCQDEGIKSYPTIKAIIPGQQENGASLPPKIYKGEHTAKALNDWALSLVSFPSAVRRLGQWGTVRTVVPSSSLLIILVMISPPPGRFTDTQPCGAGIV